MNKDRRQIRELNMLSAYLDKALDSAECKQLEERLKREPELRERLENLRRTKITLGSLARLKAPRNFTLTPEMVTVRRRKRKPLFTFLRLASSFAAVVFVLIVGLELVLGGRLGAGSQLPAEAPMMEVDSFAAESTPEPLILWGGSEGGGAGPQESVRGYGTGGEVETENKEQEEMSEEAEISKAVDEPDGDLILGLNPDEGGEILSRSEPAVQDQESTTWEWGTLRWIEVVLALVALGGGVVLWLLRRK